jgi:hypothetical protein
MMTPYQKPEAKDSKAGNFWTNLASKLGLNAPLVREASAQEKSALRLTDGILLHANHRREDVIARPDALITKVSSQTGVSDQLIAHYAEVFKRATAELGQSERVRATDLLSLIGDESDSIKEKIQSMGGGDKKVVDLVGEITSKSDSIIGSCTQLKDKADQMSMAQLDAINNAFLLLNDAALYLGKIVNGPMGMEMGVGGGMGMLPPAMPELELVDGTTPDMPPAPGADLEMGPSPVAGHVSSMTRQAMDDSYDDMRCIHTKMLLIESMLNEIVADLNVGEMLPGMMPGSMPMPEAPGADQTELPGPDAMEKEGPEGAAPAMPPLTEAALNGKTRTAASGDPGDSEPGNTIYKDLNKCRDCVWFESDFTHETYRDKCKHCVHAKLDGAIENFWPRSMQMVMWIPEWGAPQTESKKNAFQDSLSLLDSKRTATDTRAADVAREIIANAGEGAVALGTAFARLFLNPVLARFLSISGREVISEIEDQTGIDIAITASKAKELSYRKAAVRVPRDFEVQPLKPGENPPGKATCGSCGLSWDDAKPTRWTPAPSARCPFEYFHAPEKETNELGIGGTASKNGEVILACDVEQIEHEAKGEKRKIKELRQQLDGEKDPAKIKQLHDAIEALYDRVDKDKGRKEERRKQREEKQKTEQEKLDKEHAQIPATASIFGTLRLADLGNGSGLNREHEDGAPEATQMKGEPPREFKVVTVSSNRNSFGLYGVILMDQGGEAYEAAHGQLELPKKGDVVKIPSEKGQLSWAAAGYEIPRQLPAPPEEVINEVWGQREAAASGRSL